MNTITKYVVLASVCLILAQVSAQETKTDSTTTNLPYRENAKQIDQLVELKATIETEERDFLKAKVENINQRLDDGDISKDQAEQLKSEAATKRALNIENRLAIVDNKIALLERNDSGYDPETPNKSTFLVSIGDKDYEHTFINLKSKNKPKKFDKRTYNDLVFAIGFNNALIDGESLGDTYSVLGSGYVELGFSWNTRVFENSNAVRFKYGLSLQWNKFTPKDDKFFEQDGNDTTLETFPSNLIESEFRITNLVVPIFFEFGPSKKVEKDNYYRYSTHNKFKVGIGAYGGFRIGTQQKLRFKEDGDRVKQKIRRNYNAADVVYGLSAYVGFDNVSLYAKYDLNTVFKDQVIDQNNISIGLRFDLD